MQRWTGQETILHRNAYQISQGSYMGHALDGAFRIASSDGGGECRAIVHSGPGSDHAEVSQLS